MCSGVFSASIPVDQYTGDGGGWGDPPNTKISFQPHPWLCVGRKREALPGHQANLDMGLGGLGL